MRIAGFLALHREKIGTKLYGYVLAKRYTSLARDFERERMNHHAATGRRLLDPHFIPAGRKKRDVAE